MRFKDRKDAGKKLAAKLMDLKGSEPVILAIPRGGIVVGDSVARALNARLDVVVPRKLGAPYNPEFAIGAVMHDGSYYLNTQFVAALGVDERYIKREIEAQKQEIERRLELFRKSRGYNLKDRTVVLVDDGIATGATVIAAVRWIKNQRPKKLILAVPVLPAETLEMLRAEVDEVVFLLAPYEFGAVGEFYEDFTQVEDGEVIEIMGKY